MMDITYPDRYHLAVKFVDKNFGDLESCEELDNMHKLIFYALRKQVEVGPCNEQAPYMWNVKEKYKHGAWCQLKTMSKFEAMVHYVQRLEELKGSDWILDVAPPRSDASAASARREEEEADLAFVKQFEEPTVENISALAKEVLRLRNLLHAKGISCNETPIHHTEEQNSVSSSAGEKGEKTSNDEVPPSLGGSNISIPMKPRAAVEIPPPVRGGGGGVDAQTPTAGQRSTEVYYTPRKLSWFEWLGLISVDEVAEK